MHVPAPREPGAPYRIALVCLGNICRSPIAQVVLESRLAAAGLADAVAVTSAGTGDWHIGETMDGRAFAVLSDHGYDGSRHRARLIDESWFAGNDLLLGMDSSNVAELRAMAADAADAERVQAFRTYDPEATPSDQDVPDPWYGGPEGFPLVLAIVERTTDRLVEELRTVVG